MTTYLVQFDRIGRNRDPQPFDVEADGDSQDLADVLAEAVYKQVYGQVMSRDVEVVVDLAEPMGGEIYCGARSGGSFTITEKGADA